MAEEAVTGGRDLRAGRFIESLLRARGLSPEQMAKQCGVGASTIRDIIGKGTYPWPINRVRVAAFFGLTEDQIWQAPRKPIQRKRSLSEKALEAVDTATRDLSAMEQAEGRDSTDAFALGVAWAVIRGGSPFSTSEQVADRAAQTVEAWHGAGRPAPASA